MVLLLLLDWKEEKDMILNYNLNQIELGVHLLQTQYLLVQILVALSAFTQNHF